MNKIEKPKPQKLPTLTKQILMMVNQSGMTTNAIAKASGVPQPVLCRFLTGEQQNIRLDTADKLCAFFGVKLTATRKRKPKEKKEKEKS